MQNCNLNQLFLDTTKTMSIPMSVYHQNDIFSKIEMSSLKSLF